MNRATKRLLAKQEAAAERDRARQAPLTKDQRRTRGAAAPGGEREGRIKRLRRFLREVRIELRKVAWPSRAEVVTYTVVVLVSVAFVTALVFVLDFVFARGLLTFFKP